MRVLVPILANGIDNYMIVFVHDSTHTDNYLDNNRTFVNPIIYNHSMLLQGIGRRICNQLIVESVKQNLVKKNRVQNQIKKKGSERVQIIQQTIQRLIRYIRICNL